MAFGFGRHGLDEKQFQESRLVCKRSLGGRDFLFPRGIVPSAHSVLNP